MVRPLVANDKFVIRQVIRKPMPNVRIAARPGWTRSGREVGAQCGDQLGERAWPALRQYLDNSNFAR
jgi:hypothetical protein